MSPEQCRAARAWLKISMEDLATASNVAIKTIRDFESGQRSRFDKTIASVKAALERRGVAFIDGDKSKGIVIVQSSRSRGSEMRRSQKPIQDAKRVDK